MDELFEKFEQGDMPNFIEVMQAISEVSELWPTDVCLDCHIQERTHDDSTTNTRTLLC